MGDSVVVQGKKSTAELEAYVIMEVAIGEEGGGGWQGSLAQCSSTSEKVDDWIIGICMKVAIGEEGGGGWQGSLAANITKVWSGRGEVVVGSKVSKVY